MCVTSTMTRRQSGRKNSRYPRKSHTISSHVTSSSHDYHVTWMQAGSCPGDDESGDECSP